METNAVKMKHERSGCHWDDGFLVSPLCLWADGLNNEDGASFLSRARQHRRSAFPTAQLTH